MISNEKYISYNILHKKIMNQAVKGFRKKFSQDEIETIKTDTLIKAIDTFDESKGASFKTYLYLMIRWECSKLLKKKTRLKEVEQEYAKTKDIEYPGIECFIEDKVVENFENIIRSLDDNEKEVLRLKYLKNLTYKEIGKELNCSHESARLKCNRGIEKLRILYNE